MGWKLKAAAHPKEPTERPRQEAPGAWAGWRGRGRDRIYATCSKDSALIEPGVTPGSHAVQLRARLPGQTSTLEARPITIVLSCPEQGEVFSGELSTHWLEWLVLVCALAGLATWLLLRARAR